MKNSRQLWLRMTALVFLVAGGIRVVVSQEGPTVEKEPVPRAAARQVAAAAELITVPLPITGTVDTQVKQSIDRALAQREEGSSRALIVLEFKSDPNGSSAGSEFERCLSLARYLSSDRLRNTRTIAYLPNDVVGHAVLAALACEELIMSPDATLGDAGRGETHIDAVMRRGYRETAERRRTIPVAVALGMLDASLAVYRVETTDGVSYVLQEELESLQQTAAVNSIESLVQPGDLGRLDGRALRLEHGFVSHLVRNRRELADVLKLAPEAFARDQSQGGSWRPLLVELNGRINASSVNWVLASMQQRLAEEEFNLVCIQLDSPGGSAGDSVRLANYLAELDSTAVRTVAFVPFEARSDAALIGFACDELLLTSEATLGGPGATSLAERDKSELEAAVRHLATVKGRDWSLGVGLVNPELEVFRYVLPATGQARYFSDAELSEQTNPDDWNQEEQVVLAEGLVGERAVDVRFAKKVVGSLEELRTEFGLEADFERLRPNWAHRAIELLSTRRLAAFLLFVGCFALFTEMAQPGLGVPGFVAALCFLIYFWSNFLNGTAGWLEVILFVAGVAAVFLELLVIPGFGIFGIGGGLMVITSIILASQTFVLPRNSYQLGQMPGSLAVVVAAMAGAMGGVVMMRRYLPETPIIRRLLLAPLEAEDLEDLNRRESLSDFDYLLEKLGKTVTPLNPSGKARFGDDVVGVLTEGGPIEQGVHIRVVSVHGNRVVVEPAHRAT